VRDACRRRRDAVAVCHRQSLADVAVMRDAGDADAVTLRTMIGRQGTLGRVRGAGTARPHLLRISGARKSVVAVAGRGAPRNHAIGPLCGHLGRGTMGR